MQKSIQQLHQQTHQHHLQSTQKITPTLPPITYNSKDNKQTQIKYQGYMRIQKRKDSTQPNPNTQQQYMQSVYLRDLMNSKQVNNDTMEKFVKLHKIDPYACNVCQDMGIQVVSSVKIQAMCTSKFVK